MSIFPSPDTAQDLADLPPDAARPSLRLTEEEFVAWADEDVRAEWVDGEVILMAPASGEHSDLTGTLYMLLRLFAQHRELGLVRGPEFMIRLAHQRRRRVPDLLFVSHDRAHLLRPNHLEGAPDLALEIVSPDSQSRDRREKYLEYEKAGVREYWIVDPLSHTAEAYALDAAGVFQRIIPVDDVRIPSTVLPGFYIKSAWLWQEKLPDVITILREMGLQI